MDLLSKDLNSTVFQREPSDPTCEKVYVLNLSQSMDNNTYGTVGVRLDFLVNGSFVGKNRNGVVFSQFKGKNVNTQIRGEFLVVSLVQSNPDYPNPQLSRLEPHPHFRLNRTECVKI